ncbi:hypothetical protein [Acetivibrio ethanolgignens]|uniref:Uncharacterized protein n=1 Tax=Acetivibrio ethanolgignens TaxID=290052 RepID=A0A0V8QIA7_9FIRM|nr:hypothetical protein [Acetivibrio ethanolgignens]KSV60306.1 hypothetical protein ASU35_06025 [Acetivibrio ethanolgignens]
MKRWKCGRKYTYLILVLTIAGYIVFGIIQVGKSYKTYQLTDFIVVGIILLLLGIAEKRLIGKFLNNSSVLKQNNENLKAEQEKIYNYDEVNVALDQTKIKLSADEKILQGKVVDILTKSLLRKRGYGVYMKTSENEDYFFRELVKNIENSGLKSALLYLEPMSDKSFSVHYDGYQIGRIKLSGNKTRMQVLVGLHGMKLYENLTVEEYVEKISFWIKHAKHCLRD